MINYKEINEIKDTRERLNKIQDLFGTSDLGSAHVDKLISELNKKNISIYKRLFFGGSK